MRRIQGSYGDMPEEERKKARQEVINNFVVFGLLIGAIRLGKKRNKPSKRHEKYL